ncbi:NfeD family protein [Paracraurococcus lichenis]|uniref:NfeD family protein n=1 Tax=Paracraurococcus lichenis TaxID=3064888 RepID=A0ABT9DX91_9PROT|nr:NfeD family protein [Paracraurococcus sp. LOR1-02]MDO9708516.1 NfeD family protein [Paracraurococcus sp. LOR1-02]
MEPGLIWILGGLLLLAAELALPGIFLLWVGLAAIGTGFFVLAAVPGLGATALVFLLLLGGGIALALRLKRPRRSAQVNTPAAGLVGRHGMLLPMDGPELRVRLGDSDWPARLPQDVRVPEAPMRVRVEGVDGTVLVVRPV